MGEFACILVFLLALLVTYVVGQTATTWRLACLLRRRDGVVTGDLAGRCVLNLFAFPQMLLLLPAGAGLFMVEASGTGGILAHLAYLTFNAWGVGLGLLCYFVAGLAMSYCLARPVHCLYRGPASLIPMIAMAMICLDYSAGVAALGVRGLLAMSRSTPGMTDALGVLIWMFAFYIPTAPLAGLVLLIVHVWRLLPRRRNNQGAFVPENEGEST